MIVASVSYPNDPATKFDHDYYMQTHIPLVKQRWSSMGLRSVQVLRGLGTADGGPPPVRLIALLTWESGEAIAKAIAAHGEEIFADIPNFTDSKPTLQTNEPAG